MNISKSLYVEPRLVGRTLELVLQPRLGQWCGDCIREAVGIAFLNASEKILLRSVNGVDIWLQSTASVSVEEYAVKAIRAWDRALWGGKTEIGPSFDD